MARGSIVKRCPVCRKKENRTPNHVCLPQEVSYYVVYRANKKQKWEFGGHAKKDAERLLAQRLSEVNNGSYREPKKILFLDFADTWLENCPKSRVKASTFRGYKTDVERHLKPAFQGRYIANIGMEDVQSLLSKLMEGLDAKTVNNIRLTLSMIMNYARKLKYIPENPVADVKPYKVEHQEMDYLAPAEIQLLLKHAAEPFKTFLMTAIMTGMRRGEILALQWGDIDWNSNTIFVRRSIYWHYDKDIESPGRKWEFISPKSRNSVRAIVMSPKLKEVLEIHKIMAPINSCDLVFANGNGNPIDPDGMIKRNFQPALTLAGLRHIRFHDLRHTHVTLLIAQGANIKFIQRQLGHTSIQTTLDRYGHLLPADNIEVGSKMDYQLFGKPSNTSLTSQAETSSNTVYSH